MTSQFYKRYIPPQKETRVVSLSEDKPPKKKRKKDADHKEKKGIDVHDEIPLKSKAAATFEEEKVEQRSSSEKTKTQRIQDLSSAPDTNQSEAKDRKKKKKEKKRRHDVSAQENGEAQSPPLPKSPDTADRHSTVRSKYEAAVKSAAEVVENGDERPSDSAEPTVYHGLEALPQPAQPEESDPVSLHSALPDWIQKPFIAGMSTSTEFSTMPISPDLVSTLKEKGYSHASSVQSAVLPMLLPGAGRYFWDLCISAPTGSGKTLAYTLPLVESLRDRPVTKLRTLIIVPTRELVSQVRETLEMYSSGLGITIGTAVGSKTIDNEREQLVERSSEYDPEAYEAEMAGAVDPNEDLLNWDYDKIFSSHEDPYQLEGYVTRYASNVDVLIATPGRLIEHIQSTKGFNLDDIEWLIIDEADRLLDESFQQWVEIVLPCLEHVKPMPSLDETICRSFRIPQRRNVQKVILSATMTRDVSKLAALKLKRPRMIVIEHSQGVNGDHAMSSQSMIKEDHQLPLELDEIAISLPDIDSKPVYLAKILDGSFGHQSTQKKRIPEQKTDETDDDASDSDMTSSSGSSSEQSSTREDSVPSARQETHGVLVFTKDNESALRLSRLLSLLNPAWSEKIDSLTKSTATSSGRKALNRLRKRKTSILIASDRASRGLDIQDLAQVINYDMPTSLNSYVHRVGRTARAGRGGTAITMVAHHEARWFWNEIARAEGVRREPGKKIRRSEMDFAIGKNEQDEYQRALSALAKEAKGGGE